MNTVNSKQELAQTLGIEGDAWENDFYRWCSRNNLQYVNTSSGPRLWLRGKLKDYDSALIEKIKPYLDRKYQKLIEASEYQLDNPDELTGWEKYVALMAWQDYYTIQQTYAEWQEVLNGSALYRMGYRIARGSRRIIGTAGTSGLPKREYEYIAWAPAGYLATSECERKIGIWRKSN